MRRVKVVRANVTTVAANKDAAESVVEPVFFAVRHLAIARGDVRSRLKSVGVSLLSLLENEFPEQLRADFCWVAQQLTSYDSVSDEGRIEATMNRIHNSTGEKIAARIFHIYSRLQEIRGRPLL